MNYRTILYVEFIVEIILFLLLNLLHQISSIYTRLRFGNLHFFRFFIFLNTICQKTNKTFSSMKTKRKASQKYISIVVRGIYHRFFFQNRTNRNTPPRLYIETQKKISEHKIYKKYFRHCELSLYHFCFCCNTLQPRRDKNTKS